MRDSQLIDGVVAAAIDGQELRRVASQPGGVKTKWHRLQPCRGGHHARSSVGVVVAKSQKERFGSVRPREAEAMIQGT